MTMPNGATESGQRELDETAVRKSVIEPQPGANQTPGLVDSLAGGDSGLFFLANQGDSFTPWGIAPTYRDKQLRAFIPREPFTAGALATIVSTNMGLSWMLDGPEATVSRVQDVFHQAQFGEGWETWASKWSWDWYTQDKGAFSELVRDEDSPDAPVIGFNQLDAQRCWHTGNPMMPVLYQDRLGKWHGLKWYQVIKGAEMPIAHETLYGLQYCALTRILEISKIIRNVLMLTEEKTGGRHTRTVYVINGIKRGEIEQAMKTAQQAAESQGLMRWIQPVIVPTTDPTAKPEVQEISLAHLPDGFSEKFDDYFKWFMVAISMGLLRDYQDFAPLPGGGLGTSAQSQILHQKTRGKGPAVWQKKIAHIFNNNGVVPQNVTFKFDENDIEEEKERAEIFQTYASGMAALINAMALDPEGARQIMVDNNLIDPDLFEALNQREEENERIRQEAERQAMAAAGLTNGNRPGGGGANDAGRANDNARPGGGGANDAGRANDNARPGAPTSGASQTDTRELANGERDMTFELDEERITVEDRLTTKAEHALEVHGKDVRRRVRRTQR